MQNDFGEKYSFNIIAGDYDLNDTNRDEQLLEVSKIFVHPDYLTDTALIRLTKPVKLIDGLVE